MNFRNKKTDEIVTAKGYAQIFAYSHNSDYEAISEGEAKKPARMNKEELVEYLTGLDIECNIEMTKNELLALVSADSKE